MANASEARMHLFDVSSGCDPMDVNQVGNAYFDSLMPGHVQWTNYGGSPRMIAVVLEDPRAVSGTSVMLTHSVQPAASGCAPGQVLACDQELCLPDFMLGDDNSMAATAAGRAAPVASAAVLVASAVVPLASAVGLLASAVGLLASAASAARRKCSTVASSFWRLRHDDRQ
jgi:hypothetical protein